MACVPDWFTCKLFGYTCRRVAKVLRDVVKEVIFQNAGNAFQQVGIDRRSLKNLICVCPTAIQQLRKTHDTKVLFFHLSLYKFADMEFFSHVMQQLPPDSRKRLFCLG